MSNFSSNINEAEGGGGLFSVIGGIFGMIFGPLFGLSKKDDDKGDKGDPKPDSKGSTDIASILNFLSKNGNDKDNKGEEPKKEEPKKEEDKDAEQMKDLISYFACERDDDGNILRDESGEIKYRTPEEMSEYVKKVSVEGKPEQAASFAKSLQALGEKHAGAIEQATKDIDETLKKIKDTGSLEDMKKEADQAQADLDAYNEQLKESKEVREAMAAQKEAKAKIEEQEKELNELKESKDNLDVMGNKIPMKDGKLDEKTLETINNQIGNLSKDAAGKTENTKKFLKDLGVDNTDEFIDETGSIKGDKLGDLSKKTEEQYNKKIKEISSKESALEQAKKNIPEIKDPAIKAEVEKYENLAIKNANNDLSDEEKKEFQDLGSKYDENIIKQKQEEFQGKIDSYNTKKSEVEADKAALEERLKNAPKNCQNHINNQQATPTPEPKEDPEQGEPKDNTTPEGTKDDTKPEGTTPEGTKDDTKPDDTKDDTKPEGTKDDTKPESTKDDTKPDDTKDDTKPDDTKDDTKPDDTKDDTKPGGSDSGSDGMPKRLIKMDVHKDKNGAKRKRFIVCDPNGTPRKTKDGEVETASKKDFFANKKAWKKYKKKAKKQQNESLQYYLSEHPVTEDSLKYTSLKDFLN